MARSLTVLLGIVLGLIYVAGAPPASAAAPAAGTLDRMDATIKERMGANGAPGFAVAVVAGGRTVHTRGFGTADDGGRRVTPDTPFLLASSSKSFTALAVMQLVDEGKVRLDSPVRRYVPEFRLAGKAADRITVRNVLQHTTGLPPTAGGPIIKSAANGTPEQAIAELRGTTPASAPGTTMEYVNANYALAGLVVERVSKESYGRYIERHILAPLGMTNSFTAPGPAHRAGLAAGHRYFFGFADTTGPALRPGMLAAGYLMSSARDMGRYLAMYLNDGVGPSGRRLISSRGLRTLMAPGRHDTELGGWADGARSRYAMGWFVGGPWKEPAVLHPGDAADSSSLMVLLPKRDMAVVTLTNASNELAVPGNPFAISRMQRNAVDVLLGAPVNTGTSVHRFYVYVDLVLIMLLAAAAVGLVRALRGVRQARPPRHRRRSMAGVPLRLVVAALALGYPVLIGVGWTAMRVWYPDLALALAALGAMLLATAALRLAWLLRARPGAVAPPRSPPGELDRPGPYRKKAVA
jgi:CubicO group peptidase (beta-lactamase class C family)